MQQINMVFGRYQKSRNFFPKLWTQGALVAAVVVVLTCSIKVYLKIDTGATYNTQRRDVECGVFVVEGRQLSQGSL